MSQKAYVAETESGERFSVRFLVGAIILGGTLFWAYWPILPSLAQQWWNEPNYSHGFLIPVISLGFVWFRRDRLLAMEISPSLSGFLVLGFAALVYLVGSLGADMFLQRISMVIMLAGILMSTLGWRTLKELSFPVAYLLLAIPLPGIVFASIAFPLQLLAAQIATDSMQTFGIPVLREGNVMHLAAISLDVEEACSGIRSLISLAALGCLFAYLAEEKWLFRLILSLSVIPIAIAANVARVTITGFLAHHVSPDAAQGFFHEIGGLSVFMVALALLFGLSSLLRMVRK